MVSEGSDFSFSDSVARDTPCGSSSDTEGPLAPTQAIRRTFLLASRNAMLGEPSPLALN